MNDIKVVGEYSHEIFIWLEDRAGNIDYQDYGVATIYYDKTPPLKPNNMIAEPSGWSSINNFTVSWDNPNELSGIAGAFYSLDIEPVPVTIGTYIEGDDIFLIPGGAADYVGINHANPEFQFNDTTSSAVIHCSSRTISW